MLNFYYFITQGITQIITLPFWWYFQGLGIILKKLVDWQIVEWRRLALLSWLKNLFTPMFHDYTIIGRGLSFVMRLIIISIRSISLIIKFGFKIVLVLIWLILPPLIIYRLLESI